MIVMNPPDHFAAGDGASTANNRPSPRKVELQGPRPAALKVNKDSYKIRKPPIHPNQQAPPPQGQQQQLLLQGQEQEQQHKPVIIYAVSPKVIHTTVSDFMSIVQRLTGNSNENTAAASSSSGGALSPAARLASIEKTANSPSGNRAKDLMMMMTTTTTTNGDYNHLLDGSSNINDGLLDDLLRDYCNNGSSADVEVGRSQIPGILSPAPGSLLPPVSPWFFSPAASDPFAMGGGNSLFGMSPSASGVCWSPAILSPSPTAASLDIFNPFFDF